MIDRPREINDAALDALHTFLMCDDPHTIHDPIRNYLEDFANRVAYSSGFTSWIEQYHRARMKMTDAHTKSIYPAQDDHVYVEGSKPNHCLFCGKEPEAHYPQPEAGKPIE
mgnify:CR=1 FL=1